MWYVLFDIIHAFLLKNMKACENVKYKCLTHKWVI